MKATLGPYHVEVAGAFGPRITSLRLGDGPELLARLGPEAAITHDTGIYHFRGGHRLWASPEVPAVTYAPDDHVCEVSSADGVMSVSAPADSAGLVKEMTVSIDDETLVVDHRISSSGHFTGSLAPWAITQLPLGGTIIAPVAGEETSRSANRYVVLWPYSSFADRRVTMRDDILELEAAGGPEIKFGIGPSPGRLGYFRDGVVFVKEVESAEGRTVPDFGAAGQVYVGNGFCELESVGGLTDLSRGESGFLRERWTAVECGDIDTAVLLTVAR